MYWSSGSLLILRLLKCPSEGPQGLVLGIGVVVLVDVGNVLEHPWNCSIPIQPYVLDQTTPQPTGFGITQADNSLRQRNLEIVSWLIPPQPAASCSSALLWSIPKGAFSTTGSFSENVPALQPRGNCGERGWKRDQWLVILPLVDPSGWMDGWGHYNVAPISSNVYALISRPVRGGDHLLCQVKPPAEEQMGTAATG